MWMEMLNADTAVEVPRMHIGWNKFSQLVPLLINKDISLIIRTVVVYEAACYMEVRPGL